MKDITSLLYVISFLDSICYGLVMPVLPTQILILGGTHTILGIHGMFYMGLQLFSGVLSRVLNDQLGKKVNLKQSLLIGIITSVLMGIYPSYLIIITLRCLYYLTNQTQSIIKSFIIEFVEKEQRDGVSSKLNILGIFGFIIGPILGGYMFEKSDGFFLISILSASLYLICLILSSFLPLNPKSIPKSPTKPFKQTLNETFQPYFNSLNQLDEKNRNICLLRFLTSFSLTVFYTKFPLLLKVHYLASHSKVGWTIAYQTVITLICTILTPILNQKMSLKNIDKLRRFLSVLAISSAAICFAPTFEMYLISFIFVAISKSLVESSWKEIESSDKKNTKDSTQKDNSFKLEDALKGVNVFSNVFAPLVLGVFCDIYVHNGVKMLTVGPLVMGSFLGSYYYVGKSQKVSDKKKEG